MAFQAWPAFTSVVLPFAPANRIMGCMNSIMPNALWTALDKQGQTKATQASNHPACCNRNGGCVQNEHSRSIYFVAGDTELEHAPTKMSSYQLLICLVIVGWSVRDLAKRLGRHQTSVMRWANGTSSVPNEVATWLEKVAAFHSKHPAPRDAHSRL